MTLDEVFRQANVTPRFQPVVALGTGAVTGYEALARGPAGTALEAPLALFAAAAEAGRVEELDRLCCSAALDGASGGDGGPAITGKLFLNVNPAQAGSPEFLRFLLARVARAGVHPRSVVLELTEFAHSPDLSVLMDGIDAWRGAGFRVAIDDAGAGHSDLRVVAEIVPDIVKIDRGLVRGIDTHRGRRAAVWALVQLATSLSMETVAEGIETEGELGVLRALGVDHGQGFLFGRPAVKPAPIDPATHPLFQSAPSDRTLRTARRHRIGIPRARGSGAAIGSLLPRARRRPASDGAGTGARAA